MHLGLTAGRDDAAKALTLVYTPGFPGEPVEVALD